MTKKRTRRADSTALSSEEQRSRGSGFQYSCQYYGSGFRVKVCVMVWGLGFRLYIMVQGLGFILFGSGFGICYANHKL